MTTKAIIKVIKLREERVEDLRKKYKTGYLSMLTIYFIGLFALCSALAFNRPDLLCIYAVSILALPLFVQSTLNNHLCKITLELEELNKCIK